MLPPYYGIDYMKMDRHVFRSEEGDPKMKIAVGSDEKNALTDEVIEELRKRDMEVELFGPLADKNEEWAEVAEQVAERVSEKECDQGILFCSTGTGVSIAANKVPGIRAALCTDSKTAAGARMWNEREHTCHEPASCIP